MEKNNVRWIGSVDGSHTAFRGLVWGMVFGALIWLVIIAAVYGVGVWVGWFGE